MKIFRSILVAWFSLSTTMGLFAQESSQEKLVGLWRFYGSRVAESEGDYDKPREITLFKLFTSDGKFQNIVSDSEGTNVSAYGQFIVKDEVRYEEIIEKSIFIKNSEPVKSLLAYRFLSENTLLIAYGANGKVMEELWARVRFPNLDNNENITKNQIDKADLALFSDKLLLKLNRKVSQKQIDAVKNPELKSLAEQLLNKRYKTDYRVAEFEPILSPRALGKQLMIGDGYSKYEHITGIFLPEGEQVIVVDNIPEGKKVGLIVPDWNRRAPEGIVPDKDPAGWGIKKQIFELKNGVNLIPVQKGGLAYVDYYTDDPNEKTAIKIHFVNGKINGYFDLEKHTDKDWNRLIDNAVYTMLDARGKHIQVVYPIESYKKYAYGKGRELISNYDQLVFRQYEIMGLKKYNKIPKNRILSRVNYNYYMFRDADGVAYMGTKPGYAMPLVVDPSRVVKGDPCWGFSHEVGHVHQLKPYLNWGGLAEVSNNIYSLYVTKSFGNKSRLLEQNNYEKAKKEIIQKRISYLQDPDVFNRLVPFWQLHLYFQGQGQQPDFYPDLFEAFRKQGEKEKTTDNSWTSRGGNPALYQLNFIKIACEVSKTDLLDFFEEYGFFYVGEFDIQDYGKYTYKMTQEMVDECKKAIRQMNFPKPKITISSLTD